MDKQIEKETLEAIDKLIENSNLYEKKDREKNDEKIKIENLRADIKKLNNKIELVDANLKTNYITIIFGLLFYLFSNLFQLNKITGINNNVSLIIFLLVLSLFFYKENMIMTKNLLKKIIFK